MAGRLEDTIQKQESLVTALEEQHVADQKLLDSQKQLIEVLQEKISLLEEENRTLVRVGNELFSIRKTAEFLKEMSKGKLCLSEGMVCGLSREFSEKTQEERDRIFLELVASPYMHVDFTFGRVNGKQGAVMVCASGNRVLYQERAWG